MTENVITQSASHQLTDCTTRQNHVSLITLYTLYHPITCACTKPIVCIERKCYYICEELIHLWYVATFTKTYGARKCYNHKCINGKVTPYLDSQLISFDTNLISTKDMCHNRYLHAHFKLLLKFTIWNLKATPIARLLHLRSLPMKVDD